MLLHPFRVVAVELRPAFTPGAPTYEVFRGASGWTWRERASNGRVSGSGGQGTHPYSSKWAAKRAAYKHAFRVDGAKVRVIEPHEDDEP